MIPYVGFPIPDNMKKRLHPAVLTVLTIYNCPVYSTKLITIMKGSESKFKRFLNTEEELEAFYSEVVSTVQSDLAQQVYTAAHEVYLRECSKIVCKVGKLI